MKTLRWGIIGCGDVCERKSGPAFQRVKGSSLVSVMRRNGSLAQDYARRHGVLRWSDNADEVIRDPEIDAVYIATYPDTHFEYACRAAVAGKCVYVEKPMAATHAECLEMIDVCRRAGVPLWVAHYRRALPRFLKVKELLDEGAVGDVRLVCSEQWTRPEVGSGSEGIDLGPHPEKGVQSWHVDPVLNSGGYFAEGASHTLDILDMYFGPVTEVQGFAVNRAGLYPVPDTVMASYRFESGVLGTGVWCYVTNRVYEMNMIVGSEGQILFSTRKAVPIRLIRGGTTTEFPIEDPPYVSQPLLQTIMDEVNGLGRCPSTAESSARTVLVMEQILAEYTASGSTRGGDMRKPASGMSGDAAAGEPFVGGISAGRALSPR